MTDKQAPTSDNKKVIKNDDNIQPESSTFEKKVPNKTRESVRAKPSHKSVAQSQLSKTAIVALILSLITLAGLIAGYVWQTEQHQQLMANMLEKSQQQLKASEQQIAQLVNQQQNNLLTQVEQANEQQRSLVTQQMSQLNSAVKKLAQNEPTDWLIHEAEYLTRVASRTLWLEQDTSAAINLLQDADERIKALNNPNLLSVREVLNQDIAALSQLLPLATEDVIMTLLALSHQTQSLPISLAYKPEAIEADDNFELSESTSDWQENLAKTWRKFLADFITVKRRTANVEALLTPKQQQNLYHNLQLKLQLAAWAASQQKVAIYQQALTDITLWLTEYFDSQSTEVKHFIDTIKQLTNKPIKLSLPQELNALKAIRKIIRNQPSAIEQINTTPASTDASTKVNDPTETNTDIQRTTNNNDESNNTNSSANDKGSA